MKILVCPDSFKGSFDAFSAAKAMKAAILSVAHERSVCVDVLSLGVADGGEGSIDALINALDGEKVRARVRGPYGESVAAEYAYAHGCAYIEMASASGLCLTNRREPLLASTYGTGQLICDAVKRGAEKITVFVGGSATCDGGIGMAAGLGYTFYDENGDELYPCAASMSKIRKIVKPSEDLLKNVKVLCACDVTNPLYGKEGAAYVFSPQKGADEKAVLELDCGLRNLADSVMRDMKTDISFLEGGGAAGGLGAGLYAFCGAQMCGGFDIICDALKLEEKIAQADAVVTGEGCTDVQSMMGKVVGRINAMCKKYGKRCYVISGMLKDRELLEKSGIEHMYSSVDFSGSAELSIKDPQRYIYLAAKEAARDMTAMI